MLPQRQITPKQAAVVRNLKSLKYVYIWYSVFCAYLVPLGFVYKLLVKGTLTPKPP